jgi:sugar lactone lactonase YvrE
MILAAFFKVHPQKWQGGMSMRKLAFLPFLSLAFACADHPLLEPPVESEAGMVVGIFEAASPFKAPGTPAFPSVLPLPTGFQPEGIATGRGTDFFVGGFISGAVYKGDLRTGIGDVLVPGGQGRMSIGLKVDQRSNLLYVAGGFTGAASVYDAEGGSLVSAYSFATPGQTLVNDAVVTRDAVYFTDSFRPFLYAVPLGPGGTPGDQGDVWEIPLSGDFSSVDVCPPDPSFPPVNANGIDATPNGKALILINLCTGTLFRVDPASGVADQIDLGGELLYFGDGILLDGQDLYVVQNVLNRIAVVSLAPDLLSGHVSRYITSPAFRVPATVAEFGTWLYAVNARFDVAPPPAPAPTVEFEVVKVKKR